MSRGRFTKKLLISTTALVMGIVFCMSLFAGAAFAGSLPVSTSYSSYDKTAPIMVRTDAKQDPVKKGSARVEADYVDVSGNVDSESSKIDVPGAIVSDCVKTESKISCNASGMKAGEKSMKVSVKDKDGNSCEKEHKFTIVDTDAPIIDSLSANSTGVSVAYHDPSPSSGIASILVTVDGQALNCYGCERHQNGMGPYLGEGHHDAAGVGHYVDENHLVIDNNVKEDPITDGSGSNTNSTDFTCPILSDLGCGSHEVVLTITDNAGNSTTQSTVFENGDCTPPVVTVPADITEEATGPTGAVVTFSSSALDNVDGAITPTCVPASGSTFAIGTTSVTCSAADAAGNTGSSSFNVKVVDTTAPVVTYTGPSDTIYTSDNPTITGTATDAVGVATAEASIDGGPAIACTVVAGDISCPTSDVAYGTYNVVITATDAAGNAGTATGTFCKSSGRPNLTLYKVKGPYVVAGDPYRWVTVDYRMDNSGPDAYNVNMLSMTANNGIYLTSPSPLPALGNIAPGGSVAFSVKYYYPVGVTSYIFTNTACAYDQCFTEYTYP